MAHQPPSPLHLQVQVVSGILAVITPEWLTFDSTTSADQANTQLNTVRLVYTIFRLI